MPYGVTAHTTHDNWSHHAQTLNISMNGIATLTGTNSSAAGTGITLNGSVIILNVNGPLLGPLHVMDQVTADVCSDIVYGPNIRERYNTNQSSS